MMLKLLSTLIIILCFNQAYTQQSNLPFDLDVDSYYSKTELDNFRHTTYIDSLIFDHTLWQTDLVIFHIEQTIMALKECRIRVIEASIKSANLADYNADIDFEKDMGFITEETLEEIGKITERKYKNRGSVLLYLDTNGSVDGTMGEANSGERQASIFYHQFSPLINKGSLEIAPFHKKDANFSVTLHEIVHLYSGDSDHKQTKEKHVLNGDVEKASNNILAEHCSQIRQSPLVNQVNEK